MGMRFAGLAVLAAALAVAACGNKDAAAPSAGDKAAKTTVAGRVAPVAPSATPAAPPSLDPVYWAARRQLLALGYRPAKAKTDPWRVCADAMENPDDLQCEPDMVLPEVADCSGTGMGFCLTYWIASDGRVLKIITAGEPQPYGVHAVSWATPEDLADLPAGWKR